MVRVKTDFVLGQTVWIRSYNARKASMGIIMEIMNEGSDHPMAEVGLAPGWDYYDWDHDNAFIHYEDNARTMQVELYRLEPVRW